MLQPPVQRSLPAIGHVKVGHLLTLMPSKEKEPIAVRKAGKNVSCPICGHDRFLSRDALLNTRGMTFFNLDWANKKATVHSGGRVGG